MRLRRMLRAGVLGGGGVAPPAWTPASTTTDGGISPHTWLYPDVGLYQNLAGTTPAVSDGDVVGNWTNQGSDASAFVQNTADYMPLLKLNIVNGQSVLRFDGVNDYLVGSFTGGISQPSTLFVVAQLAAGSVNDGAIHAIIDGDDSSRESRVIQYSGVNPDAWRITAGTALTGGDSDGNWNIWTVLWNGATSQFWLNGLSEASGNAGAEAPNGLTIGAQYNVAVPWSGDIAEILWYPGNLSDADKNEVGQYLATKYALSYTPIT